MEGRCRVCWWRPLERTGRRDEAARLRQYGLEPGGKIADEWN
jgi:hypothetical protein